MKNKFIIIGGSEDTWMCQGSAWIKHGNPSQPMPQGGCGRPEVVDSVRVK